MSRCARWRSSSACTGGVRSLRGRKSIRFRSEERADRTSWEGPRGEAHGGAAASCLAGRPSIVEGGLMCESYEAQLRGVVFWRLDNKSPKEIELKAFPGWSLIIPFADGGLAYPKSSTAVLGRMPDDSVLLGTQVLRLKGPAQQHDEGGSHSLHAFSVVGQILRRLRYLSKQAALPRIIVSLSSGAGFVQDQWQDEISVIDASSYFSTHTIRNAVASEHLGELAVLEETFVVPAHVEIMLDALQACVELDYRRTILYSAMAIEIFASRRLDDWMSCIRRCWLALMIQDFGLSASRRIETVLFVRIQFTRRCGFEKGSNHCCMPFPCTC